MINKDQAITYINDFLSSEKFVSSLPDQFFDEITGKSIRVLFTDLNRSFIVKISDNSLSVYRNGQEFDVEISSSTANFVFFILTKGSDKFSSKIKITGDIDTANKFNNMLANSEDIRYFISKFIGESNYEFLYSLYSKISPRIKSFVDDSETGLKDFLLYDLKIIPSKNEINKFLDDVDDVKSRTENLLKKYKQ